MIQIYSDMMATDLRSRSVVFFPVHVVRLSFTERRRKCVAGHGFTFFGTLPSETAELGVEDGDREVDAAVAFYGLT